MVIPKKYYTYLITGALFTAGMLLLYPQVSLHAIRKILPMAMVGVVVASVLLHGKMGVRSITAGPVRARLNFGDPDYRYLLLLFFSLLLNLAMLFDYWLRFENNYYTVCGRVPFSDAMGYLYGAQCLVEHGAVDAWAARRPLASCFYAVLLKFTDNNLSAVILVVAVVFGISVYRLAKAVTDSFGFAAGFFLTLFLSFYHYPLIAAPMTENVGLIFANFAGAILWSSVISHSLKLYLAGLIVFGLALSIRIGALFAVPLLILYGVLTFGGNKKRTIIVTLLCLAAGGAPFILNSAVAWCVAPEESWMLNGNLSYTLYGLVNGDKEWQYIFAEHPELFTGKLSDGEISKRIYQYTFQEFAGNPRVAFRALATIYYHAGRLIYRIGMPFDFLINPLVFMFPWLLAIMSPWVIGTKRAEIKCVVLCLFVLFGVWASWPVVKSAGFRAIAVTVPFTCAITAAGIGIFLNILKSRGDYFNDKIECRRATDSKVDLWTVAVLSLMLLLGPLFLKATCPKNSFSTLNSGGADSTLVFRIPRSSSIVVAPDGRVAHERAIPFGYYRSANGIRSDQPEFNLVEPGQSLYSAVYNLADPARPCHYLCIDEDIERFAGSVARCSVTKKGALWFGKNITIIEKR